MKTGDSCRGEPRRDALMSHLIAEDRHDPYRSRGKLPEPVVCKQYMVVLWSRRCNGLFGEKAVR